MEISILLDAHQWDMTWDTWCSLWGVREDWRWVPRLCGSSVIKKSPQDMSSSGNKILCVRKCNSLITVCFVYIFWAENMRIWEYENMRIPNTNSQSSRGACRMQLDLFKMYFKQIIAHDRSLQEYVVTYSGFSQRTCLALGMCLLLSY